MHHECAKSVMTRREYQYDHADVPLSDREVAALREWAPRLVTMLGAQDALDMLSVLVAARPGCAIAVRTDAHSRLCRHSDAEFRDIHAIIRILANQYDLYWACERIDTRDSTAANAGAVLYRYYISRTAAPLDALGLPDAVPVDVPRADGQPTDPITLVPGSGGIPPDDVYGQLVGLPTDAIDAYPSHPQTRRARVRQWWYALDGLWVTPNVSHTDVQLLGELTYVPAPTREGWRRAIVDAARRRRLGETLNDRLDRPLFVPSLNTFAPHQTDPLFHLTQLVYRLRRP
jgi:hypothetical protein